MSDLSEYKDAMLMTKIELAQLWLQYARDCYADASKYKRLTLDSCLDSVEEYKDKANASYEEIGIPEEEFKILRLEGYKRQALRMLFVIRRDGDDRTPAELNRWLNMMEVARAKGSFSYEDIDTTEYKVSELRKKAV